MGLLADRVSRRVIVGAGVAFWSFATFMSGLANSFGMLLGFRALVGVGEASYGPAAVSMISDNFPSETNSQIQGVFNVGMLVGGTLGAIIGGLIVQLGSRMVDSSLRTKLNAIKHAMKEVG